MRPKAGNSHRKCYMYITSPLQGEQLSPSNTPSEGIVRLNFPVHLFGSKRKCSTCLSCSSSLITQVAALKIAYVSPCKAILHILPHSFLFERKTSTLEPCFVFELRKLPYILLWVLLVCFPSSQICEYPRVRKHYRN